MTELNEIQDRLRSFSMHRDWGKYHSPKNLSMALSGEVGELLAEFQWLSETESQVESLSSEKLKSVTLEIADVTIYLLLLCETLQIDILDAVAQKIDANEVRFPVDLSDRASE